MSHVRSLRFDALEARRFLTTAHAAGVHTAAAVVARPLMLNGTLAVDNAAAFTTVNADGSTTTSTPIGGQFGALGQLRGVWNETGDSSGDITGVDVLRLHNAKGSVIVVFNDQTAAPAHPMSRGVAYYQHAQSLYDATGAYVGDSESGSVDLVTKANTRVVDMVIQTATK